jgi:hypothetical protein
MTLSFAAQVVLDAYQEAPIDDALTAAAVLRSAVACTQQHHGHDVWECDADELLAIANELEASISIKP